MKRHEKLESILDFVVWLRNSDSGIGLCHISDKARSLLSDKEQIEIIKSYIDSPEIKR